MRAAIALAACLAACAPVPAFAQAGGRLRLSVNGGVQVSDNAVSQSFSVEKNLEPAPITVDADENRGSIFDAGVSVRIKGHFGAGFAVSYLTHRANADITARIPHPFLFNQPRTLTGSTCVNRTETGSHVQAVVQLPVGRRFDVLVSGGPSFFHIDQTLVTDITFGDAYPFDAPTFGEASKSSFTANRVGFNVGADLTWKFSQVVGVGALVRYTRATADVSVPNNPAVTLDLGGLQIAAGVRVPF
jgi:opacity protein-like surface antigen